jgi:hypothetical protein
MFFVGRHGARLVMCDRITVFGSISPRPETFSKTVAHRLDEERIRMVLKEGLKNINFDWSEHLEKIWMVSNSMRGERV